MFITSLFFLPKIYYITAIMMYNFRYSLSLVTIFVFAMLFFSCSSDIGGIGGGGVGGDEPANSIIITLTYWETKETDGLFGTDKALDPKISFNVISRQDGRNVSNNSTGALLDRDNVGQTWSGSAKSSAIPFITSADELRIQAIVIEKDPLADDDISPGYYKVFSPPFKVGSGTVTLDYGNGKSKVRFDYEFVWR